jgi:hypothetical protein
MEGNQGVHMADGAQRSRLFTRAAGGRAAGRELAAASLRAKWREVARGRHTSHKQPSGVEGPDAQTHDGRSRGLWKGLNLLSLKKSLYIRNILFL